MNNKPDSDELLCFTAMAGIFPGAASVDALWQRILRAEIAPLTDMTARWGIARDAIFSPEPGIRNRTYLDRAYCLPLAAEAGFSFPWGHQMAHTRSVLKQVVEQAEQGGAALEREDLALVLGTSWSDESYFMADARIRIGSQQGIDPSAQVQELARFLGLGGPALSIDTACSSFAYALEMANTLIRTGQARRVIVAGVNAFLPPSIFLGFSQLRALSRDATLRAFGEAANGIVPGECVAAFLIEPAYAAARAGRQSLGALRSLGISSDGAEGSVFAPGKQAQLIAYARAYDGIDPGTIDYIEAHGTGTQVGDAIELDSLDVFFRPHVAAGQQLAVGSVKTLIGHSLAAAGAAALTKALLMLRHRTLPPHVALAPHARLHNSCLALTGSVREFPARERALRIGISSFGFGGANAHIVIEESELAPARSVWSVATNKAGAKPLNLAIVDLEAAFGSATSAHDWQRKLELRDACPSNFPQSRFADDIASALPPLRGRFLSGTMNIDCAGYRMGPRPIGYIDPFKLLVTHRAKTMLERHPAFTSSLDTAIVVCANIGGERFFDAYRKILGFYSGKAVEGAAPDITVDDVPTMLPTMISGYPSQILNLRGFHQTISGAPGVFWTALLAAPNWLNQRCRTLVLGAGRYLSSPADVAIAANQGGSHGEGIGLLALKSASAAREDGNRVLATIRCVVDASHTRTLEQARVAAQTSPDDEHVEICELSPGASIPLSGAQASTGFLGEASGIESVLAAVMCHGQRSVVEVRRNGTALFWLFLDKEKSVELAADPLPEVPFALSFSGAKPAPEVNTVAQQESTVVALTPPLPLQLQVVSAKLSPGSTSLATAAFDHLTRTLINSLRIRSRAIGLLSAAAPSLDAWLGATPSSLAVLLGKLRSDTRNIVLTDPHMADDALRATMRIDESHSYFFDHPLDHVPGILLLEGVLQLAELAVASYRLDGIFINSIDVRFKRYTEKQEPVTIELKRSAQGKRFEVSVVQAGNLVCDCVLVLAIAAMRTPGSDLKITTAPYPNKRFLHKSKDENVLVGALEEHAEGIRMHTVDVPAGHFFRDGNSGSYSLLYFLEIARQCFMLVAHTRLEVPIDVPMNLIELSFAVDAQIPRDVALTIIPEFRVEPWTGLLQTRRVTMMLLAPHGPLGKATIMSQVIDKDIYAMQRHAAHTQ